VLKTLDLIESSSNSKVDAFIERFAAIHAKCLGIGNAMEVELNRDEKEAKSSRTIKQQGQLNDLKANHWHPTAG